MKLLFDLFPVILFFAAFKYAGNHQEDAAGWLGQLGLQGVEPAQAPILLATVVVILATFLQIGWSWFRHRRVDKMLWFSLAIVVLLGGLTLYFKNANFIKWKPTILHWGFAAGLTISNFVFRKNLIRTMLEEQMQLPDPVWSQLNAVWIGFFLAMGFANLYVAFNFSESFWVDFKVFWVPGFMMALVLVQAFMLSKYIEEKK